MLPLWSWDLLGLGAGSGGTGLVGQLGQPWRRGKHERGGLEPARVSGGRCVGCGWIERERTD